MSATIIILPVIRSERPDQHHRMMNLCLNHRDYARLERRAKEWGVSPEEAAAGIIENELHRGFKR